MNKFISAHRGKQRGYVLVLMGAASFAVLGAAGLAIDMGRLFINKQETQAFVDSAAIAAVQELDGTTAGITRAKAVVTASTNRWNMGTAVVSNPVVEFATSKTGTYSANPNPATGYIFARVTATVPAKLYFLPLVNSKQYSQNVASRAIAAQVAINSFGKGLGPYTAVAQNSTGPQFGLTIGQEYDIQWPQFNDSKNACKQNNPKACFNKPPCAGDTDDVLWNVAQNWGSQTNGYWGFSSNSDITASVLDGLQTAPVSVGDNIMPLMTNGNKNSQAGVLDTRVKQDQENTTNVGSTYLASPNHNGRRFMVVPIVEPKNPNQTVVDGWGLFLLETTGSNSNFYQSGNGNDPYCAVYVGPYTVGSNDKGGATSGSGAYYVTLVL